MKIDPKTITEKDVGRAITAATGPGYDPVYVSGTIFSSAKHTVLIRTVGGGFTRAHKVRVLGLFPVSDIGTAMRLRDALVSVRAEYVQKASAARHDYELKQQDVLTILGGDRP